jgi:hypothetical protein
MISLYLHTKPHRRYFAPLLMALLYFLGYLLALIHVVMHKNSFFATERYSYLLLESLENRDMFRLTLVLTSGMAGIICATLIAESIFRNQLGKISSRPLPAWNSGLSGGRVRILIWLWLAGSLFLMLLMWNLGIGRGGLMNETILPFKLAGIMVYSRNFLIPFIGIVFLEMCLRNNQNKLVWKILFMLIFLGGVGSITAMSRSYFFFTVLPPLFYLTLKTDWSKWNRGTLVLLVLSCVIAAIFMVTLVQALRGIGYTGDRLSLGLLRTDHGALNMTEGAEKLVSLAITRVIGLQELLRVYDAEINDIRAPISVFIGRNKPYISFLLSQVTGRSFESDGFTAFGYGYGLWGMWFMSGSYLLVFLASSVFSLLVILVEELFLRKGAQLCALYLSLTLTMWTWGGVYLFFLNRAVIMVMICYVIMLKLRRRSNSCSRISYLWRSPLYE